MTDERLPSWDGAGHLAELALVALADGQDALVDADARRHVETCEACADRLAALALESLEVGALLERQRAPRRLPIAAVGGAVALAAVGLVPSLLEPRWVADALDAPHRLMVVVPLVVQAVRAFASAPAGTAATFAASLLFVSLGALVARQARPSRSS